MAEEQLTEEQESAPPGLRSFWSGTITFGLVSVPVSLYAATRPRGVSLRMIDDEGAPLERRYVCSKDGKELSSDEIVRGYEVSKGKFVTVTDEELEAIEPRKSRDIDLQLFVSIDDVDPMYFERAYFLVPSGGTNKAYRLLAHVMESTRRAGIATFVMRAKEYLVAILAEKGILRAETLRFEDEIRKPADVGLPKKGKASPAAVKKFEREISQHSGKVNFREFVDQYAGRLEKLVEQKRRKSADIVKVEEAEPEAKGGEVIDLLQVLRQSLGGQSRKPARRSARQKSAPRSRKSGGSAKRATAKKHASSKKRSARKAASSRKRPKSHKRAS